MVFALIGGILVVLALVWLLARPSRRSAPGVDGAARHASPPPTASPGPGVRAPARAGVAGAAPSVRAATRPPGRDAASAPEGGSAPLVLIVDDSPVMRRSLTALFSKAGYRTACAADGSAALSWVRGNGVPSLVTLDMEMPGMDGRETLEALQGLSSDRAVRAVFVTNKMQGEHARSIATQTGVVGFFSKPYDPAELLALAHRVAPLAPPRSAGEPVLPRRSYLA